MCLPVVSYTVNGRAYTAVGPEYKGYHIVTRSAPWAENRCDCYEKDQVLYIDCSMNRMLGVCPNPLERLHPRQSAVEVCYCPERPKLAYVVRYCDRKRAFWLTLLCACAVLATDLLILIAP